MKRGDMEAVRSWYAAEEVIASTDPTPQGHFDLIVKQAHLQLKAGLTADAFETLETAHWDAMNRNEFESARRLEDIVTQLKENNYGKTTE